MKTQSNYKLRIERTITAPNGNKIDIFVEGEKRYVMLRQITRALGYSGYAINDSLFGIIFKNHQFSYYSKSVFGIVAYVTDLEQIIPILRVFISLTLTVSNNSHAITLKQDNARMEAQRLIELLNREVFGKSDSANDTTKEFCLAPATPEKQSKSLLETKENIKMENNNHTQNPVHVVSVEDIEDIGNRVKATITVFRVAEKDALRAVTKLKAEEINRDLSPLIELLG